MCFTGDSNMNLQYCVCICGCKDMSWDMICDLCKSKLCYLSNMKGPKKEIRMFLGKKRISFVSF